VLDKTEDGEYAVRLASLWELLGSTLTLDVIEIPLY